MLCRVRPESCGTWAHAAMGLLLDLLAGACLTWYVVIWSICLLGASLARSYYLPPVPTSPLSHAKEGAPEEEVPGITIVRPLAGLDCNLAANLSSSFELLYPADKLEILISVKDEHDQALRTARDVQARYPHVRSKIIVGDEHAGVNPKINNLVRPYAQAAFDLIWVVDSQVWLPPGAAGRAVQTILLPPPPPAPRILRRRAHGCGRVGLLHHVPLGVKAGGGADGSSSSLGSQVERAFLSTTHAKMYLALNALAIDSCVMGKSNMYRRSDLARVPDAFFGVDASGSRGEAGAIGSRAFGGGGSESGGGRSEESSSSSSSSSIVRGAARPLARFGIYLAEDNMLALSLWRPPLNLAHAIVQGDVAHTSVGDIATLRAYASRRMRWIRVRKHMVAAATYIEPITESIPAGLMGLFALRHFLLFPYALSSTPLLAASLAVLAAHFTLWHLVDRSVLYALSGGMPLPPGEELLFTFAWVVRELLALPIWAWAVVGSTVDWRGHRYRILSSGRAAAMPQSARGGRGAARHRDSDETLEQSLLANDE